MTFVLGVLLPIALAPKLLDKPAEAHTILILVVGVISAFALARIYAAGRPALVESGFWLFMYVWAGLAPLIQTSEDIFPLLGFYGSSDREGAALMSVVVVLFFAAGTRFAKTGGAQPSGATRILVPNRLFAVGMFGILTLVVLLPFVGGPAVFLQPRSEAQRALESAAGGELPQTGLIGAAIAVPVFVGLYGLLTIRRKHAAMIRSRWIPIGVLALAVVLVSNPISSPRYWFGTVFLSLAFALFPLTNPRRARAAVLVLVAGVLVVFPIADAFRSSDRPAEQESVALRSSLLTGDYDAFQQVMNTNAVVDMHGHTWGRQLSGALLFWVPRAIWQDKPLGTGTLVAQYTGYSYTNLSSPIWAEASIDFGWVGLIAMSVLLGWIARHLDVAYRRFDGSMLAALAPIVALYEFWVLRGSLVASVSRLSVLLLLFMLCSRSSHERGQQHDTAASRKA